MSFGTEVEGDEPAIVGTCANCKRPLTQVGPKGECLRCLVSLGFASESEQSEHSDAHRRLVPGPLKYDHFEVEIGPDGFPMELGAGAMAITYRARDTVLNSIVALKVIDRRVAQNPGARSRFLREARAAAQIQHRNVARVTHYGEQEGECFYVMELVQGETLEARVRRDGPLPLALALEVIEQATRALAAAEARGVVHRDIKPSNIMLKADVTGTLVVKVIDYGVAKVLASMPESGADQTRAGFIGTPAFASPEQFSAGLGQTVIDTRSDIYSLGVTFWYLLCGRVPFVGRSLEDISARQAEGLPFDQLKGLHIPARCVALLRSMLDPDPAKRPQSARELLSAVHRCYTKFSTEARARKRRATLAMTGVTLALAGTALGAWLYQRTRWSAEMRRSIAVLPFENLSANGEDSYFTVGMQDEITRDLARLAGIRVIGTESTRSYLPGQPRDLRGIARDLGVSRLLEGTVSRDQGQMRVSVRLVDPRNLTQRWAEEYQRPLKDVFALQNEITRAVASHLQARLSPNESRDLDLPPTTDQQAYDLYLRAGTVPLHAGGLKEFFAQGRRAIDLLEKAVARDPNFALAYCRLASWHDELYFQRNVGPPEEQEIDHRSLAEVAFEKARRLQPNSGAVHLGLALHAIKINRDPEEADAQLQLARQTLPNNAQLEELAGRVARRQDRWDEALRCFQRAVSLEPRDAGLRIDLADTARFMRRYDDFDRTMAGIIPLMRPEKLGELSMHRALGELERSADIAPLRAAYSAAVVAHQLDEDDAAEMEVRIAIFSHDSEAISRFLSTKHTQISFTGVLYPDSFLSALATRMRGDNSAVAKAFVAARPDMEKQTLALPADGIPLSMLAIIDAALGHKEAALEEGKRACELSAFKQNNLDATIVHCNFAVVYAWLGENDLAMSELDKLIERPASLHAICQPTYGDFRLNPYWDPLRNDPRFEVLVQKLAPVGSK